MNFSLASVLQTPAKISQPARQKKFTIICKDKFLVRKYCSKNFLNEVHFQNMFYKKKSSKMNAQKYKHIDEIQTNFEIILKKVFFSKFLTLFC
jgi:hypothetical protein